jgi:hypothetical protein
VIQARIDGEIKLRSNAASRLPRSAKSSGLHFRTNLRSKSRNSTGLMAVVTAKATKPPPINTATICKTIVSISRAEAMANCQPM